MTASFTPRDAARLRERLAGRLVLPGQEEYDAARQVWNASHDHRPALIAQPLSVADAQAAVRFAGDRGLAVSVRGGGHNHAGYAVADGALMLDLSALVSVRADAARRVATVGGGATWGTVDQATVPHVAPPPTVATRRAASARTETSADRSSISAPSATA